MRVSERLRSSGVVETMFVIRSVSLDVKREFYERVVVTKVVYGMKTCCMRMAERVKVIFMETKF